ncbi:MAG: B12-binding domain-containing radical SAM protein [Candidatus Omnitrophica bacterium]|nr:B12-binding domain-containing radical SAM protein [Candidatus Omnitrophota bacterium]
MKILLINPPIREWARPNVLPLGLGYIASVLRNAGHEVEMLDINAYRFSPREVEGKIRHAEFDVVGIGGIVTVYKYIKWLIAILKRCHPSKKIVIGGSVGTSIPHIILNKTEADVVCIGEGEITIVELIDALEKGNDLSNINGIWFKQRDGKIHRNNNRAVMDNLDTIPFPAWDLFPMDIYLKNPVGAPNRNKWIDGGSDKDSVLSMNLSGTRGCPYKCIYCYHDFMGQRYRHRSVQSIIKEMKYLNDNYKVEYFHFVDDEFCLDRKFVSEFCKALKSAFNSKITWGCAGRVNLMTEDLVIKMADAGCVLIGYGIESGSQKILDRLKKGVTVAQAKEAVRLTVKHLGWADCSFMIGSPGENLETIKETVNFCKELNLTPEVIFFITPYPGTELYDMALSQGKIKDEEEYLLNLGEQGEKVRINFTELSDEELMYTQEWMIKELDAWNKTKHAEARHAEAR